MPKPKLLLADTLVQALVPVQLMCDVIGSLSRGQRSRRATRRVEDSAGYKLMWKLGVVSSSQQDLVSLEKLKGGI